LRNKSLPEKFIDPFDPKNEPEQEEEPVNEKGGKGKKGKEPPKEVEEVEEEEEENTGPKIEYTLGKQYKDGDLGDASYLCRRKGPIPH